MKRKIITLLLAIFACFTIAACDNGTTSTESFNTESSSTELSESVSESSSVTESEESNVESDTESDSTNDSTSDSNATGGGNVVTPIKPGGNYEW